MCNIKVSFPLQWSKLRKHTKLAPVKLVSTRWSSIISLLPQFIQIKEHLSNLVFSDIDALILSNREDKTVDALIHKMERLDSVSLCLHRDDALTSQVRVLFDTFI